MLTRLKVSGFKNLSDVDVRFGPFTCVAGANGVGKSNLFDAIMFLSGLSEKPLIEAAMTVREKEGRAADVRHLFHRMGDRFDQTMSFEAEMVVPHQGVDDFGQKAEATITTLRYSVRLAYCEDNSVDNTWGGLELIHESLEHIKIGDARKNLQFKKSSAWLQSAVKGRRTAFFISTEGTGPDKIIKMHQDSPGTGQKSWGRGRGRSFPAANLPRTVLSTATNAMENPTAMLARKEMQSWRLIQLEPSALRNPDDMTAPRSMGPDGSHLPATLYRLARNHPHADDTGVGPAEARVYAEVAGRLSELIDDVIDVRVDRDEKREILTLEVVSRDGTPHPARSLSDGTLRFLALTVFGMDHESQGLLCLEEPENGIHPERIPAMIRLLQDIATDTNEPVGPDNPLNQVIINTHSPAVVGQIPDQSLLVAELREAVRDNQRFKHLHLACLDKTWRTRSPEDVSVVSKGRLLAYLNPILPDNGMEGAGKPGRPDDRGKRVVDREDMQMLLPLSIGS